MFSEIFKYSSISTKIRAMYKKLLDEDDYKNLIEKKSVADVAEYLKNRTNYNELLSKVNVSSIHRGQLESILIKQMINDYDKIFHHVNGNIKQFIQLLYDKYEIESLKVVFRILEAGQLTELDEDSFAFLSKNESLNISKLKESRNSRQLIANLKGSIYYDILKDYENNSTFLNLFNIETSLDQYYFSLLTRKKKKLLEGQDEKIINDALIVQIDIMNLLWIYRSKKYFTMDREEIFNNMIQNKSKLNRETIKELVDSKDEKQFNVLIKNTRYKDIFETSNQSSFERNYNRFIYKMHLNNLRRDNFSIGAIVAYIHLKEFEISNVISIVEGIRYNIDKENIKQFVVI
ncbi:MAG: V-type ATPase subunit [Clostridia bacterium]|nr:V-type ATPase subunit [Clostridia bacterium]